MAEETLTQQKQENTKQSQEQSKKSKKKKLMFIALVVFILLLGGTAGWWFFFSKDANATKQENKHIEGVIVKFEPFIVNLADPGRYTKFSVQLEVNPKFEEKVKNKTGHIRDVIIFTVGKFSYEELLLNEGKMALKDEIRQKVNRLFGDEQVVISVSFLDFVMQ